MADDRVVDDAQPPFEQGSVVELLEPVVRLEQPSHVLPGRSKRGLRKRLRHQLAVVPVTASPQDEARVANRDSCH